MVLQMKKTHPTIASFDIITHISPVLQAQHDAAKAAVVHQLPVINIGLPPEMIAVFCALPPATPALTHYVSHFHTPGTNMQIAPILC